VSMRNLRPAIEAGSHGHELRRAFTLLEILVVLSILVVLVSLSWPALLQYVGERTIREQAHAVRMELARTRTKAIDTGLTYQFRFEPGGGRYVVLPNDIPESEAAASGSTSTPPAGATGAGQGGTAVGLNSSTSTVPVVSGAMPSKVQFEYLTGINDATGAEQTLATQTLPDEWLTLLPQSTLLRDVGWSPAILFFADGTADDAQLVLIDEDDRRIEVTVRGLTGSVTSRDIGEDGP
jgi:prepilin-type N-terminal cleavage/methylation domain-containing protein